MIANNHIRLLIYMVSLSIQSAIDMTIENRCSNIKLASPICFTKDTTCHIQFPQQVNSKSIMKANFITSINQDTFGGVLLYHLQREDTSISTRLLVIWGCWHHEPYLSAFLIEHESTLAWKEDKLKRLYHAYHSQYNIDFCIVEWLLNDDTILKTPCGTSYEGFKMKVFIFECEPTYALRKPLWIDSNR
jgi:hypothetical protein